MIEKSLRLPTYTKKSVRREIALFSEADGKLTASGLNVKRDGGCIVPVEGAELLYPLPLGAVEVTCSVGHKKSLFAYGNGTLFALEPGRSYQMERPNAVLAFLDDESGEVHHFVLTDSALYCLSDTVATKVEGVLGATCGAVYYERFFTAKGVRVYYSKPLAPTEWALGVQTAGYVDLPSAGGDILALVPYKEKLYAFRKQGITLLRAVADTLNFKATEIPFSCGSIIQGSVQNIGERILFFTENGLYAFNGATCARFDQNGQSLITKSEPMHSASFDGKYYAAVEAMEENVLFCADYQEKTGCFFRVGAVSAAGTDRLYFSSEGMLYALSPQENADEWVLFTELSLFGLSDSPKWLDAVCIEGEGRFFVEAQSAEKLRTAEGKAGEKLRFCPPLKGNAFSFRVKSRGLRTRLKAITLSLREEKTW